MKELPLPPPSSRGELLRRIYEQPVRNPATAKQSRTLVRLINRIGRAEYQKYKTSCDVPAGISLARLDKGQAWRLINTIIKDLKEAKQ